MRFAWLFALTVLASSAACSEDEPVLFVELRTDLVPGVEFVSIRTTIEELERTVTAPAGVSQDFVTGERVAELAGIPIGAHVVRVALLDTGDAVVAERTVRVDFARTIGVMVLITRDCRGVTCGIGMTCIGGGCASDACHEELRPAECGVRECSMAPDCVPAGASCASPRCETGSCLYVASDAACASDEYCDVDTGCRPLPTPPDGGARDGGATDGAAADAPMRDGGADAGPTFGTRVAAGTFHSCTTRPDGHASCWGIGTGGTLGEGSTMGIFPSGQAVSTLTDVVELSAGPFHTCAIRASGGVSCWGRNTSGQLGDLTTTGGTTPTNVVTLTDVTAIDASFDFTCAVEAGRAYCWGANDMGQLGDGMTSNRSSPVEVSGIVDAVDVALSQLGACVRRTSGVTCFGFGYFGNGMQTNDPAVRASPSVPASLSDFVAGTGHFCALLSSGELRCWGDNSSGQVGAGPAISMLPEVVSVPLAREVWAGEARTCARTNVGEVYCWGRNHEGQLGDGTRNDAPMPARIPVLDDADTLSLGDAHTCFTRASDVFCVGWNESGQLGDGTMMNRLTPMMVLLD